MTRVLGLDSDNVGALVSAHLRLVRIGEWRGSEWLCGDVARFGMVKW